MSLALFDTNILIDHLKGRNEATNLLKTCIDKDITMALSVKQELN